MKRTRHNAGFTLVEVMTAVAIVAVLSGLAYAALEVLPQRTRLTGGALEFASVLSSARSHAYGRNQRVAVLIDADVPSPAQGRAVRYWVVVDPWSTLDQVMKNTSGWRDMSQLVPLAPPAVDEMHYPLIDSGHFNESVRVLTGGYQRAVGVVHRGCTSMLAAKIGLAQGHVEDMGSDTFPPPFCFIPNEKACTFCSGDGNDIGAGNAANPIRGAVFFEPDGRVVLTDAEGEPVPEGAGSITFVVSGPNELESAQSVIITNSGLVRTISANAHER